ncbi:hypothetical protein AKJ16_DCAP22212 [Drosera capensis]
MPDREIENHWCQGIRVSEWLVFSFEHTTSSSCPYVKVICGMIYMTVSCDGDVGVAIGCDWVVASGCGCVAAGCGCRGGCDDLKRSPALNSDKQITQSAAKPGSVRLEHLRAHLIIECNPSEQIKAHKKTDSTITTLESKRLAAAYMPDGKNGIVIALDCRHLFFSSTRLSERWISGYDLSKRVTSPLCAVHKSEWSFLISELPSAVRGRLLGPEKGHKCFGNKSYTLLFWHFAVRLESSFIEASPQLGGRIIKCKELESPESTGLQLGKALQLGVPTRK